MENVSIHALSQTAKLLRAYAPSGLDYLPEGEFQPELVFDERCGGCKQGDGTNAANSTLSKKRTIALMREKNQRPHSLGRRNPGI